MKTLLWHLLAITVCALLLGTASAAKLVLKDGTVIQGEIVSLQNATYTVKSNTLGTLKVRQDDIKTIDHAGVTAEAAIGATEGGLSQSAQITAAQSKLAQDPTLLSKIEALQSDPQVQAILSDPEIMRSVAAGDYAALMNHPKIIALTQNAQMREIIDAAR